MSVKRCSKALLRSMTLGMGKVHAFYKSLFCQLVGPDYPLLILPCVDGARIHGVCILIWKIPKNLFKAQKKKRSQSDKIGRLKYNQQLLKQTLAEVEEVKLMLRTIFAGLKGSFNFEQSLIEHIACIDEVDREILRFLFEAG